MTTWFQRFENTRDRALESPRVARFDRLTSPHTHPGTSAGRILLVKLRVLLVFLLRRIAQGRGRTGALESTRRLAGSASGREVLVIGSGPSASLVKKTAVVKAQQAGELVVVATNFFLNSSLGKTITPDYLVWSDDIFRPANAEDNRDAWEALTSRPAITLVCPWTWKDSLHKMGIPNPVVFFDDDTLEGWSNNISPLRPRGYQGSTGQKALAFALHLGAHSTSIIGLDLSYYRHFTVDDNNRVLRHPVHLKGTDTGVADLTPHTLVGLADELYSAANNFRALHTHFRGAKVRNLDPNSLVDAFPKATDSPYVTATKRSPSA
jgi:hypothetical protein